MVLLTVVKPFQYFLQPKLAKEPVPQQLESIAREILVPLVSVLHRLIDKALTTHGWDELELEKTLHIICKCLYFSVKSHMPSALSPLLGSFCQDMIRILDSLSFDWSVTPSDGYLIRSKAGKRSLLLFCTLVSRHRKYSDKYANTPSPLSNAYFPCLIYLIQIGAGNNKLLNEDCQT
jgi:hypothetical protein